MGFSRALITGGSGLLGANIIKELLLNTSTELFVLMRNPSKKKRAKLYDDIIAFNGGTWSGEFPYRRVKIIEGDITLPNLGLAPDIQHEVTRNTDIIYHSAAVIKLSGAQEEVQAVNVAGTRNLLEFASACKERGKLDKVVHVSTIAVSGDREGIIYEDELDVGQGFNNPYEKSKFEAEKIVREYRNRGLNIVVVRPSMVIGDSITGFTNNFNIFYFQLRLLSQGIIDVMPLYRGASYNVVPADAAAKAICLISHDRSSDNKNFHIVNSHEIEIKYFIQKICRYLRYDLPKLISLEDCCPLPGTFEGMRGRVLSIFFPYISKKKIFDTTNAQNIFQMHGFEWPRMDRTFITKMLDACIYSGYLSFGTGVKTETRSYSA